MKYYKDLNLKEIRDKVDLDFAHYTYRKGMCSCCYGPPDLTKRYWKDGIVKRDNYTYILFKNADNGSGVVTRNSPIGDHVCVGYTCSYEQKEQFSKLLMKQLDSSYVSSIPKHDWECVVIHNKDKFNSLTNKSKYMSEDYQIITLEDDEVVNYSI